MPLDYMFAWEEAEGEGRWFDLPADCGGEFFGVSPISVAERYQRRLESFMMEWRKATKGGLDRKEDGSYKNDPDAEQMGAIIAKAMAGCTVTKIRGVLYQDHELDSSIDSIRLVLKSRKVRLHVNRKLNAADSFKPETAPAIPPEVLEGAEGNSAGDSIEISATAASATPSEN